MDGVKSGSDNARRHSLLPLPASQESQIVDQQQALKSYWMEHESELSEEGFELQDLQHAAGLVSSRTVT